MYLYTNFTVDRWLAFKRYVILVIVLVGDLFFISTSLVYTFYFFKFQRGELGWYPETYLGARACEVGWKKNKTRYQFSSFFASTIIDAKNDELKKKSAAKSVIQLTNFCFFFFLNLNRCKRIQNLSISKMLQLLHQYFLRICLQNSASIQPRMSPLKVYANIFSSTEC